MAESLSGALNLKPRFSPLAAMSFPVADCEKSVVSGISLGANRCFVYTISLLTA
jgi:hypothetical protein